MPLETWELLSYIVTVVGLPCAIGIFVYEQRKERENEDEEVYQLLSDNYQDFLKVALENPDLRLFSWEPPPDLAPEGRRQARADHLQHMLHLGLLPRARVPPALRRVDDGQAVAPLAFVGGLHARMVRSKRFPQRAPRSSSRRRSGLRELHRESRARAERGSAACERLRRNRVLTLV